MSARREARRAQLAVAAPVVAGVCVPDELRHPEAQLWHDQKRYRAYMAANRWSMPCRDRLDGPGGASPANRRRAAAKAWATEHGIEWDWARLRAWGLCSDADPNPFR